jgi:cell wall-associated NlpC family hydrolase
MPIKGGYLLAAGGGAILLWSGIRGKRWSDVLRSVVAGKDPRTTLSAYTIQTSPAAYATGSSGSGGVPVSGSGMGSQIAIDAEQYKGTGYVWGGAPGNGKDRKDCSSFANMVIGRDLGLAIPMYKAGSYHGQSHGPTTVVWLVWSGAVTVPRNQASAGDLAVWQTHMGIILDNNHMISALNSRLGTQVTTIDGGAPTGELLRVRRLK